MEVLNLYACLGGNRKKWTGCNVTAVELDPELARMYKEKFPLDTVINEDAHMYLLENYNNFDFIWTSPPCPSHSKIRFGQVKAGKYKAQFPDLKLYEEIIFLTHHFKGKFVVENVASYYEPLIAPQKRGRHYFWANFKIPQVVSSRNITISNRKDEFKELCDFHEIDLSSYKGIQRKDKIARNLVDYEAGLTIFEAARGILNNSNQSQMRLF